MIAARSVPRMDRWHQCENRRVADADAL